MTSLTVNGSAVAATTLAAAGKLFNATGGSSGNTSTKVGSGTLNKQIFAKGTSTNQSGVSSIPAPTDSNFSGWMWDVDTLAGQVLLAGTLTPTFHLLASTGTTVTPTVQWFKRTSAGVWSQLATVAGSSIALTTSSQALTFTPPSMSDTSFATGDRFCCWLWVNQTAGGATNSTISVVEATSGSSAGVASEVQTVTPGYAPSTNTDSSVLRTRVRTQSLASTYASVVLADSPIRYYRLGEAAGTVATDLGSQAQNGTISATGITAGQKGLVNDPNGAMLFANASSGVITLPTTSLPTGSASWSMEAWVSMPSLPAVYRPILDLGGGYATLYAASTNKFAVDVHAIVDLQSSSTFTTGVTYHVVATYDGNNLTLYVNGSQVATQAVGTINVTYGTASIGYDSVNYWNGTIDEAAVYSTVLSLARIQAHHTAGALAGIIPVAGMRLPVRTQVTRSAVLRIVTSTSVLATKVASLRTRVRTQVSKTISALRTPVRTQATKTISGIRTPVRTKVTTSLGLRVLSRTQQSVSSAIRVRARTQKTVSTSIRAVIKGITSWVSLRVPVRSQISKSSPLRTKVRSLITRSAVLRVGVRTTRALSSSLRAIIASLKTATSTLRVRVRSQHSAQVSLLAVIATKVAQNTSLRTRVRTQVSKSAILRTLVRTQQSLTTNLRTLVQTLATKSAQVRTRVRTQVSKRTPIRTPVRTMRTLTTQVRIVVQAASATLVTRSLVMRALVRTTNTLSISFRALVRTGETATTPLRTRVRTLATRSLALRARVRTQATSGAPLRAVIQGRTWLVSVRTLVRSQESASVLLRMKVETLYTLVMTIRTSVRTGTMQAIALRIIVVSPPALPVPVQAYGRDGIIVAYGRDGLVASYGRDGTVEAIGRDGHAVAHGDDGFVTGRGR